VRKRIRKAANFSLKNSLDFLTEKMKQKNDEKNAKKNSKIFKKKKTKIC